MTQQRLLVRQLHIQLRQKSNPFDLHRFLNVLSCAEKLGRYNSAPIA